MALHYVERENDQSEELGLVGVLGMSTAYNPHKQQTALAQKSLPKRLRA
jgi:hypothetical protein